MNTISIALVLVLSSACAADNATKHLVPVRRYSFDHWSYPVKIDIGRATGICLDRQCSIVATVYHSRIGVGRANLGIVGGHRIRKVLSLGNADKANAVDVPTPRGPLQYDIAEDISFVFIRGHIGNRSGVRFSYGPYVGEKVRIVGFVKRRLESRDAHIVGIDVPVLIGKAQMKETLILDLKAAPGMSGSAVLDQDGNLLGMATLTGFVKHGSEKTDVAVALPVRTIAKALKRLDPQSGASVFGEIPPDERADIEQNQLVWDGDTSEDTGASIIPDLSVSPVEVPGAVERLRENARTASNLVFGLAAKQCLTQGSGKPLCLEISITEDGDQTYQQIKSDHFGPVSYKFPVLPHGTWIGTDWADTLEDVAENSWVLQGSVDDHYLFTFRARAEDERCSYEEYWEGLSAVMAVLSHAEQRPSWEGPVACFEQVITDKGFNVVSVFIERRPPDACHAQLLRTALYYDWVQLKDSPTPLLLPVRETETAEWPGNRGLFYTKVEWTDYRKFRTKSRMIYPVR